MIHKFSQTMQYLNVRGDKLKWRVVPIVVVSKWVPLGQSFQSYIPLCKMQFGVLRRKGVVLTGANCNVQAKAVRKFRNVYAQIRAERKPWIVGDVIFTPNDTISAQKCTNASWAIIRGAHNISKKTNKGTKGNRSGLIHRRSYADVAAAPA